MKNYVLYHGNCPDGCGAALAAWLRFGDEAEYIPVSYGQQIPDIPDGSRVYIIDFSYPRPILESLNSRTKLTVLDHHTTAQKDLEGLSYCVFDMNKSGAILAWEFFHGSSDGVSGDGQPPEFFRYLQDRDLWKFDMPMSREVSMALRSYPMDFRLWSELSSIRPYGNCYEEQVASIDALKREGVACKRLTDQQVSNMAKNFRWVRFDLPMKILNFVPGFHESRQEEGWYYAPCSNATVFFSEVGENLLENHKEALFSAYYLDRSDGKRQWGLRSRMGFDCSVIAKAFGGGGHQQASGFIQDL